MAKIVCSCRQCVCLPTSQLLQVLRGSDSTVYGGFVKLFGSTGARRQTPTPPTINLLAEPGGSASTVPAIEDDRRILLAYPHGSLRISQTEPNLEGALNS